MGKLNNKWIKNVLKIAVVIVLALVIVLVWKRLMENFTPDNVKFSHEYTALDKDNVYVYATKEDVLDAFKADKAVVFFGFPECDWCQEYVRLLNEIAKEYGVQKILYYNIKEDRENNSDFYMQLIEVLKEHLYTDDDGNARIYVPDVYFIKHGKIIGHNNDTSTISDMELSEYYTDENTKELQQKLNTLFIEYSTCDDKKGC